MDVDFINKIAQERKTRIERDSKRQSTPELSTFYNKMFVDYGVKVFLDNEQKLLDIQSKLIPNIPYDYNSKLLKNRTLYVVLLEYVMTDISKLRRIDSGKLYTKDFSKNANMDSEMMLKHWVGWMYLDNNNMKDTYGEPVRPTAIINSEGRKIVKGWEDYVSRGE